MAYLEPDRLRLGHLDCVRLRPPQPPESNPPVVLVHGLGGGVWGWENFQRRFAEHGFTTYAVELPGHRPGSPQAQVGDISVETYALYVAGALAELGPCFVVGHSMGGLIAQKLAETHPQPGYVMLCSAPPWHMVRPAYWPMWRNLLRHPWRDIIRPAFRQPILLNRELEDRLVNHRVAPDQRAALYALDVPDSGRASLQMVAGLVEVNPAAVQSPCLVVGGADDRLIPASETRRLAAYYGAPLLLPDCGHMPIVEPGWEKVADAIVDWLNSVVAGSRPGSIAVAR